MKVYEVSPGLGFRCHTEDNLDDAIGAVRQWINDADIDDTISITSREMSKEEYDNLPEYEGP